MNTPSARPPATPASSAAKLARRFGPGASPKHRLLMILAGALPPALPFIGIALLVFMLLATIVPSGQAGQQSGTEMLAYAAAETDGVDAQARAIYQEAGENAGVPWEVLAAIVEIHDNEPETDEQKPLSLREVRNARRDGTPVAPYNLVLGEADKTARTYERDRPVANRMNDLRVASAFVGGLLRALLAERGSGDTYGLDAGLILVEDDKGGSRLDYEGGKPNAEARRLAKAYIGALGRLPVDDARAEAEATYTLAMAWHMGQVKGCDLTIGAPMTGTGEWVNPAIGPISTHFGENGHDGTDIDTPNDSDQPVVAASSGTVVISKDLRVGAIYVSYGRYIIIDHGGGIKTLYAHLSRRDVQVGSTVSAGQQIGLEGTTGNSTGDHLHFQVFVSGASIDPEPFMAQRGITVGVGGPAASGPAPGPAPDVDETALTSWTGTASNGETLTLDEHQVAYAAGIVAQSREMGLSTEGAVIALMTVAVESRFQMYASDVYPGTVNAPHDAVGTDHDSVGLFQQRPISGWGPRVVVGPGSSADRNADALDLMDVTYSTAAFFGGPSGPNHGSPRGLLDIPGWESMAPGDAAQAVQASGFGERYAMWETAMTDLYAKVGGGAGPEACEGGYTGDASGGFTFATFNALGHGHTVPGGNKPSFPASDVRLEGAVEAWQAADVSVLALQEFQSQQRDLLLKEYGDTYDAFPRIGAHNSNVVAWRTSDWALVSGDTFPIPYFNGINAQMPYVLLQNQGSGQRVYVISIHNPADARGPAQQWRNEAVQIEKNLATRLASRGHPVLLAGDFNDVDEAYCPLVPPMTSAFGAGSSAPCRAPAATGIDQIFGAGTLSFSGTTTDHSVESHKISDHPLVTTHIEAGPATAAIDFALAQVGDTYRLGATGPDTWDCSSLMQAAWRTVGVSLPRTSRAQSTTGTEVEREDLRPGDLIFYYSPVSHVAMYVGEVNGVPTIVHAANPSKGVLTAPLSEMEGDIVGIRRVLSSGG